MPSCGIFLLSKELFCITNTSYYDTKPHFGWRLCSLTFNVMGYCYIVVWVLLIRNNQNTSSTMDCKPDLHQNSARSALRLTELVFSCTHTYSKLMLLSTHVRTVTAQRKHQSTFIVNYTFIVPCPANERFQFHPSQVQRKHWTSSKQPNMPPLPPVMLSNPHHRVCETAGPFQYLSEWDSFSQFNIFSLIINPLPKTSYGMTGLMKLSS